MSLASTVSSLTVSVTHVVLRECFLAWLPVCREHRSLCASDTSGSRHQEMMARN